MVRMLTETPARKVAKSDVAVRAAQLARAAVLLVACALLSGCGTLYVMQAARGQYHVLRQRVPIEKLLADPHTPPQLRARLERVQAAREFASRELALPDNKSYRTYADIGRPFVVWNVVATPEFSVHAAHWCFPIAGCVAYRGYFSEQRAREFGAELAVRGFDVAIEGVPAYSTLGKFADPVLSSMLPYGDDEVAATIFHELAHQLIYVRDDSEFNEAFATTVENTGLERWLAHQGETARMQEFREDQAHATQLEAMLERTRGQLAQLYASGAPRDEMRVSKAVILHALATDIQGFERRAGLTYPVYEEWIAKGLNNADLASLATYYDCVPGFARVLQQVDNDLPRFYAAVRKLGDLPRAERHARLCVTPAGPED
jgi:predicted aminopeptidase